MKDQKDSRDNGGFMLALSNGKVAVAQYLWENGMGELEDSTHRHALIIACTAGQLEAVQWLQTITETPLQSIVDADGDNGLGCAAYFGHLHVVRYLIETGEFEATSRNAGNGMTPLLHAACKGHLHVVKWLIESQAHNGVDPWDADSEGDNALATAVSCGMAPVVDYLVTTVGMKVTGEHKFKHSTRNSSLLIAAACSGSLDTMKSLVAWNGMQIGPEDCDDEGDGPFVYAMQAGHASIVKWMLKSDLVYSVVNDNGYDCVDYMSMQPQHQPQNQGTTEICHFLMMEGYAPLQRLPEDFKDEPTLSVMNQPWSPKTHKCYPKHMQRFAQLCVWIQCKTNLVPLELVFMVITFMHPDKSPVPPNRRLEQLWGATLCEP
eukprot:TRINITY_DN5987_c0_g1_i1.p1 TRINITY_DN5987_c0_g1~~TRINITY_DN5987_c0_g1_i1.p1  ORF type:complete len:398 (-),score=30.58 TRINITY_DN5987_c0_g1_i1:49-1179(-)